VGRRRRGAAPPAVAELVHQKIETRRCASRSRDRVLANSAARGESPRGPRRAAARSIRSFPRTGPPRSHSRARSSGRVAIVWAAEDRRDALDAYVADVPEEEIQAEAVTRNLPASRDSPDRGAFPRPDSQRVDALRGTRASPGPRSRVSRDPRGHALHVPRSRLRSAAACARGRHPKLYWVDPGLARAVVAGTRNVKSVSSRISRYPGPWSGRCPRPAQASTR